MNFRFAKVIFINHSVIVSANIENYSLEFLPIISAELKEKTMSLGFFQLALFSIESRISNEDLLLAF
jgi:hypothetical protein